ncbi:hypothetical protein [Mycolicibacterium sp. HK-90]|nr:hypothetical protein [Mycolicibacterium sp. HK-90]WKG03061.1 hypothetical protein QU592_28395 [Mycolicibacterium sp. HK-90]
MIRQQGHGEPEQANDQSSEAIRAPRDVGEDDTDRTVDIVVAIVKVGE